jgi:HD-like signal output (HDOD) protein
VNAVVSPLAMRNTMTLRVLEVPEPEESHALQPLLERLETELCRGIVVLPAWSERTEKVRRRLIELPDDVESLALLASEDPGLAVRLLAMANAAPFARGGRVLAELSPAIHRIGHLNFASVVHTHVLAQLRQSPRLLGLRPQLLQLWHTGAQVAALARRIAWRSGGDADQALLAGILHNAGRLYLMARCATLGQEAAVARAPAELLWRWQARLGAALARAWELPATLARSLARQGRLGDADNDEHGAVLAAAAYGVQSGFPAAPTAARLASEAGFALNAAEWRELIDRSAREGAALRITLGD